MSDADRTPVDAILRAIETSHQHLRGLLQPLDAAGIRAPAYPTEWSIAQTASHLGSGAAITRARLEAGLDRSEGPGNDVFHPIWDEWNAKSPEENVRDALDVDRALIDRLVDLDDAQRDAWYLELFGTNDLAGFLRLRLFEHVVHTWDIAVALDPTARLAPDAVPLLVDHLAAITHWTAKATEPARIQVLTADPDRQFLLDLGGTSAIGSFDGGDVTATLRISAEALIRLVYGRLADDHRTPVAPDVIDTEGTSLEILVATFPGP